MIKAILTDIEGTTSSLSFVKNTLFPYARKHIASYVKQNAAQQKVLHEINQVRNIMAKPDASVDEVIAQLIEWIDNDQKITPLKSLQGMIWQFGYANRDYYGHMYDDAVQSLKAWHADGIKLYVFSSGSIQAQKLLFAHTEYGDLCGLFSGYFDTTTGAKNQSDSYQRIARDIGLPAPSILFLSDIETELQAAIAAGMQAIGLQRDENIVLKGEFTRVASFAEIQLQDFS